VPCYKSYVCRRIVSHLSIPPVLLPSVKPPPHCDRLIRSLSLTERVQSNRYLPVATKGRILSHSSVTPCDKTSRPQNQHNISVATCRPPAASPSFKIQEPPTQIYNLVPLKVALKRKPLTKNKLFRTFDVLHSGSFLIIFPSEGRPSTVLFKKKEF
jgi:hypothetical protein